MPGDKTLSIHTYAVLQRVGEKLKLDPKQFALDVLDQCIDPNAEHAVRRDEGEGELGGNEMRTFDAAMSLLRNEGREEAASRLDQLRAKLLTRDLCVAPAPVEGVIERSGLAYSVSKQALTNTLSVLASLYKKGGHTSDAHETVLDRLGISTADKAPVKLESWRSFGAVLRDLNMQTACFKQHDLTTEIFSKINPQEQHAPEMPEPQPPSPLRVPEWTSWLVREEGGKPRPNGYSCVDRQAAALFLSHAPSEKTEVASEHLVFSAVLDCVAGKETELFVREGGVWCMQRHGSKHVTVPGWSWKALHNVLALVLEIANLHSTVSNACAEGLRQEGGPTLPLFCTTLSRMIHVWHEELLSCGPKLLIGLKRRMRPFQARLRIVARLLRPEQRTFPIGSVLLQALYRELQRALSMNDEPAHVLLLPLLNETMQPLLHAVSNYMHGLHPGVWLETEGHLMWEKLPFPKFLDGIEESAASAGGTIKDIKYIHSDHIVLQQLADSPLPTVDLLGCERKQTGVNGILGAIVSRPPPILPITRGVQLSVWGAVETAEAIGTVRRQREQRLRQAEKHAEERKTRLEEVKQQTLPTQKHIGIPSDWPGSRTYKQSQILLQEEKAKRRAERAAQDLEEQIREKKEQTARDKERELEEERATLSPRFTNDEIQAAADQVVAEYKAKMDRLENRDKEADERSSSQVSCMEVDEVLVDSCSELGPPPTETTEMSLRTAEDPGSDHGSGDVSMNAEEEVDAPEQPVPGETGGNPSPPSEKQAREDKVTTLGSAPEPSEGPVKADVSKHVPQGQVQTVNILQWEEAKPKVVKKKKYRPKKVTAATVRRGRAPRVAKGGPKRKRVVGQDAGRPLKQVCHSTIETTFSAGSDCIVAKGTDELIVPTRRSRTQHDEGTGMQEEYDEPKEKVINVYAKADEMRKLRHSIPEPVCVTAPPKSIAERLERPVSIQRARAKEQEESFTSVGRLKALYQTVKERAERGVSVVSSPEAAQVTPCVKDSKWALEVLISNWTGLSPVQPELLPVSLRGFPLPLTVSLDCTLRRAIEAQKNDIDEAIQEATVSKARLNDTLAVLHTVYLAQDTFLSAEIAFLVDEAAARRTTPINAKGRIALALNQMRTEVASSGRHFDPSECVKLFTVEVLEDIGTASGGLAARAGRNEYAEDYVQLTYATPERLRRIVTDTHLQVYQKVHRLLLALRSAVRVSTGVLRKCARVRSSSQSVVALCLLRYEVQRMLQGVLTYLSDGLRAANGKLMEVLNDRKHPMHPTSVPGYRSMHSVFVEGLQRYTMLTSSFKPQYRKLRELIRIALELPSVALVSPPSMSAVQSLRAQFAETKKYIVDSLVSMLHSTDESTVSPFVLEYNVANWPRRSQWAKELLARIDPAGAVRASNLP